MKAVPLVSERFQPQAVAAVAAPVFAAVEQAAQPAAAPAEVDRDLTGPVAAASGRPTSSSSRTPNELPGYERDRLQALGIRIVDGEVRMLLVEADRLRGVALAGARSSTGQRCSCRGV